MDSALGREMVLQWLQDVGCVELAEDLVPGANRDQRRLLHAAGGLVAALTDSASLGTFPEAIQIWAESAPHPPTNVVDCAVQCIATDVEWLSSLYSAIVDGPHRRKLGTFFTPPAVVDLMLDGLKPTAPDSLLVDPGAGVGAFALRASQKWRAAEVVGVDVNVVTLGLLGTAAFQAGAEISLVHGDYVAWCSETPVDTRPRIFVGNPPYTRHQDLTRKHKQQLFDASGGLISSRLAGLSTYFLATTINSLRPLDQLSFILPSTWLQARYGRELKEWISDQPKRRIEVLHFDSEIDVFPATRVDAMILSIGPERPRQQQLSYRKITSRGRHLRSRKADEKQIGRRGVLKGSAPLLNDFAAVRRGVATGANSFFFLDDEQAAELPHEALKPVVARLGNIEGDVLDQNEFDSIGARGKKRWLLDLSDSRLITDERVRALVAEGKRLGIADRYLARVRPQWYVIEQVNPAPLLCAIMTKQRFRIVHNAVGAIHSNSVYGIYPKEGAPLVELMEWLRSDAGQQALRGAAKIYSGGLLKLEPRALASVRLPPRL